MFLLFCVPDPIGHISVDVESICSRPSLRIQWIVSGSGHSEITSYTLRWRRNDKLSTWAHNKTLIVSGNYNLTQHGGSYTLTGLESGILYDIEVEATNSLGSNSSDIVRKATVDGMACSSSVQIFTHVVVTSCGL